MTKKAATVKKAGIVVAARATKELHRAAAAAAKADGISLGAAILQGLALYVAAPRVKKEAK